MKQQNQQHRQLVLEIQDNLHMLILLAPKDFEARCHFQSLEFLEDIL
jgi:hypothetical protein